MKRSVSRTLSISSAAAVALLAGAGTAFAGAAATAAFAQNPDYWHFDFHGHHCNLGYGYKSIVSADIKTPAGQSDLLVGVSMVSGIFTDLEMEGGGWGWGVLGLVDGYARQDAGITVCAILDHQYQDKQCVLWNSLFMKTSVDLAGLYESEEARKELQAQTYNFAFPDAGNGDHTVQVKACYKEGGHDYADPGDIDIHAAGVMGPATLTIQGVNLKGPGVQEDD